MRSGITKLEFVRAIKAVERAYQPDVEARGAELVIHNMWTDGTVNAQAYREGSTWHVDAFGGLARYPGMRYEGFVLVLCHEVGHHLGGRPRYGRNTDWGSVEGQADYWATLSCMKRVAPALSLPGSVVLAHVLADLGGEPTPRWSTPDFSRVSETFESHPRAQCRLDTYGAGHFRRARPRCWFAP